MMYTTRSIPFVTGLKSLLVFLGLTYGASWAGAQSDSSDTATADKAETSIELIYTEANNRSKILTATVKTKVEGTYQPAKEVGVNFYQKEVDPQYFLGTASSNEKGIARLIVPEAKLTKSAPEYTFVAAVENDKKFEDNQEEITVAEADFNMTLMEVDSVRQIVMVLQAPDSKGNAMPVGEAEIHLYVQRLFGLLPLSDNPETTDENGEVTADFPAGIPGDTAGNLIVVARVEEHERFGNLEFSRKINWGVPLIMDPNKDNRELWSSRANAPVYLIVLVNTMLIGIWGVIAYIIFQVFQIRKIGRRPTT